MVSIDRTSFGKNIAKSSHPLRKPSPLPDSANHQLNKYALVATAAGVSMLALAQPAEARIVYTKTHQVISEHTQAYMLDLNNDGNGDFVFTNYGNCTSGNCFDSLGLDNITGKDRIEGQSHLVLAVAKGEMIGPKSPFPKLQLGGLMAHVSWTSSGKIKNSAGHWINVSDHYVGLRFTVDGKAHFGWARLNVSFDTKNAIQATLTGYAYETTPNKPIIAGKTHELDAPGTLGQLALGRK